MNAILLFTIFFVASQALTEQEYQAEWNNWKNTFDKSYASPAEHGHRYETFKKNVDFVKSHDAEKKGYTVALNRFADLTGEEFRARYLGLNFTAPVRRTAAVRLAEDLSIPSTWDWVSKGAVTKVKNQGQCGSCWSFSTTGSVEGAHFIKTGKLVSLSEQNLIDCSTSYGNEGCNGGLMDDAFQYIIDNKGIDTEASYPYETSGPNSCKFKRAHVGATISSFKDVPQGDEKSLLAAVYSTPVSVAIDASQQSFQFYSGGVYYEPSCSSTQLDHGVLAVGFGTENGKAYWLVKNSWGESWGLSGYIKMSRDRHNNCGIATAASFPVV